MADQITFRELVDRPVSEAPYWSINLAASFSGALLGPPDQSASKAGYCSCEEELYFRLASCAAEEAHFDFGTPIGLLT